MKQKPVRNSSPLSWLALIFAIAVLVLMLLQKCDSKQLPAGGFIADKIDTYKDNLGEQRTKQETGGRGENSNTAYYKSEIERLTKALGIKENALLAVTDVNAKLRDSVRLAKLTVDEANNKIWNWEKTYASGSTIKATMNEKDSILRPEVDVKLQVTDYVDKGGLFGKTKYYTDIYSPDQNISINGLKTYRKETVIKPKRVGIGVQFGYGLSTNFKITPYVGLGLSYNLISF